MAKKFKIFKYVRPFCYHQALKWLILWRKLFLTIHFFLHKSTNNISAMGKIESTNAREAVKDIFNALSNNSIDNNCLAKEQNKTACFKK